MIQSDLEETTLDYTSGGYGIWNFIFLTLRKDIIHPETELP